MARVEPDTIDFGEGSERRADVVEAMVAVTDDLGGWVTFEPLFDEEALPPVRGSWLDIFSGRGPVVPDASWVPGERRGERVTPLSLGLRHPAGAKAVVHLDEAGIAVPEAWRKVQDHPKRGLVLELRPGVTVDATFADATLDFVFDALRVLTPLPLTGIWRATVHRRR